jgi:hypothetical protein
MEVKWNYIYMGQSDNNVDSSAPQVLTGDTLVPDHDFIEAICTTSGSKIKKMEFCQIVEKPEVLQRSKAALSKYSEPVKLLNVLLIGWDSTSHAQFERRMENTLSFMEETFEFTNWRATHQKKDDKDFFIYELDGHNAVGDGTTINLSGLLTGMLVTLRIFLINIGKPHTDHPEARIGKDAKHVDDWPWLFRSAENNGYPG